MKFTLAAVIQHTSDLDVFTWVELTVTEPSKRGKRRLMRSTDKLWTTKGKYLSLYLPSVRSVFSQLCVCWAGCAQCIWRFPLFLFSFSFVERDWLLHEFIKPVHIWLVCLWWLGLKLRGTAESSALDSSLKAAENMIFSLNWQLYLLLPEIVRDVQITITPSRSESVQKVHSGDEIFGSPSFTAWLPAAALRWHEPENFSFLLSFAKHNIFLFQLPASFIITADSCIILEGKKLTLQ